MYDCRMLIEGKQLILAAIESMPRWPIRSVRGGHTTIRNSLVELYGFAELPEVGCSRSSVMQVLTCLAVAVSIVAIASLRRRASGGASQGVLWWLITIGCGALFLYPEGPLPFWRTFLKLPFSQQGSTLAPKEFGAHRLLRSVCLVAEHLPSPSARVGTICSCLVVGFYPASPFLDGHQASS